MNKILITGITGFIGSHLAINFTQMGFKVIGLKRSFSDISRLHSINDKLIILNSDEKSWKEEVEKIKPDFIIHSAWEGVSASDRDNWDLQFRNIILLNELLTLCKTLSIKKFISLGSQAEYGDYISPVTENSEIRPNSNYGFLKHISYQISDYSLKNSGTKLFWLRLFPLFGEGESENWFIPMVVKSLTENNTFDMTFGEQQYAYLYIKDFCNWIFQILSNDIEAGIYNVSSIKNTYSLKYVVGLITEILGIENSKINFGAIPYRINQNMKLVGDMSKLKSQLNPELLEESNFESSLSDVIKSLNKKYYE
jgi:nucleoside-diphosphate-sugar epimerase